MVICVVSLGRNFRKRLPSCRVKDLNAGESLLILEPGGFDLRLQKQERIHPFRIATSSHPHKSQTRSWAYLGEFRVQIPPY